MPRYLIERELPGAAGLPAEDLQLMAKRSNHVLSGMAGRAQWVQSYVLDNAIMCIYIADCPESVREHANAGGFPVTEIRQVHQIIDPTTGGA